MRHSEPAYQRKDCPKSSALNPLLIFSLDHKAECRWEWVRMPVGKHNSSIGFTGQLIGLLASACMRLPPYWVQRMSQGVLQISGSGFVKHVQDWIPTAKKEQHSKSSKNNQNFAPKWAALLRKMWPNQIVTQFVAIITGLQKRGICNHKHWP